MQHITKKRGYAIGEMSRRSSVHIETIRYYERIAIMPKPDRTEGGNRQYNHAQLKRLSFIKRCRELDFSIEEIRALLEMVDREDFSCAQVNRLTLDHLSKVEKKLTDLRQLESDLKAMAAQCSKGDIPHCPIIDTLYSEPDIR